MLIISKKKDYYDGIVSTMGIDKTLVYERETQEFEKDHIPEIFEKRRGYWGMRKTDNPFHKMNYHKLKKEYRGVYIEHAYFIVGFCGKLYIGWKLYKINKISDDSNNVITTITYDNEYIMKILEEKSWHGNLKDSINYILSYDALQMFRDLKSPVFVYDADYGRVYFDVKKYSLNNHHSKFFVNPLLKNYEFYKVFNAFLAFQEVSMFMGGVLGKSEKEIVEVQDKYKITQHGFDYKWSFRKESEKNK